MTILSRAGQYLQKYERARYTFRERYARLFDLFGRTERIILPPDPEHFGDVSFYQAGMNWDTYALNARAAIIRIGQNTWPDTSFVTFYNEAKAREIALGGYWFFDGRASPDQQLAVIKSQMSGRSFELELFVDWERDYGGAYEGLPRVVELMQKIEAAGIQCKAVGMYTGYYWFVEHSSAAVNAAQYTYLKQRPLWLAWYSSASVVKVPPPWSDWTHWQYGTPPLKWGQPTVEIDANYFNGSKAKFEEKYLGGTVPTEDTTSEPFAGVTSVEGMRYGWNFCIDIIDARKARVEVTHEKTYDYRETVSAVARSRRASLGYNGGEWDRNVSPYRPLDYSVSNGKVYQPDSGLFRPSLLVAVDGGARIIHDHKGEAWQAVTGARYILLGGKPPAYLGGSEPQYVEGHNRTCYGVTADGRMMVLTSDGAYPNQGLTLKQAAELMAQYGAVTAFDGGGGGDTTRVKDGIVTNVPQDGAERRVPEFVLVYAESGGSMVNGQAKEVLGKTGTVRTSPEVVSGNDTGKRVQPFSTIEFVEVVAGKSVPTDKWFRLPDGNYLNYILAGRAYFQITKEPIPDVPPTEGAADMPFTFTLGGGDSPYVEQTITGVVKAK